MNCPHCKQPGADGRNYCGACGSPLVQYCRPCGFRNLTADRYCGGCGSPLAEGAPCTATARPAAPGGSLPGTNTGHAVPGLSDLLEAARETEEVAQQDADVKVSQGDIDSLFGD